jgi:hypothetical protein
MTHTRFRRAIWFGTIVIGPLVWAFAIAPMIAAAAQQPTTPPPALQASPAASNENQVAPVPGPISAPEIDALAADLAPFIAKRRISKVTVFGAKGPNGVITLLGLPIGDAFSVALTKHAKKFKVIDRSLLREALRQKHVAEKMLSNGVLAAWITSMVKADGYVILELEDLQQASVTISAQVYDARKLGDLSFASRKIVIPLSAAQAEIFQKSLNVRKEKNPDLPPGVIAAGSSGAECSNASIAPARITLKRREARNIRETYGYKC